MDNKFDYSFYIYINNLNKEIIDDDKKAIEDYNKNSDKRILFLDENELKEFDPLIYLITNKDLFDKNIINEQDAKLHYIKYGKYENRIKNVEDLEKILVDFNWLEYLYKHKNLFKELNSKRKCYIHYLLYNFKNKYNLLKNIAEDFYWNFYRNYYVDIKNKCVNYELSLKHYIFTGINDNRNEWYFIYKKIINLNYSKYLSKNPDLSILTNEDLLHHWLNYGIKEERFFINKKKINTSCSKIGIAVSIYSDIYTPNERLIASFMCLNYLSLMMNNCKIILVIDGSILKNHLDLILNIKKYNKNISVYKNKINYGIAKTKNICLSLLNKIDSIDYYCLIDDDILIKRNFTDYIINIFQETDIPIITNFNKELPYFSNQYKQDYLIKSIFFLGNILILSKKYFKELGYFHKYKYRWGDEHIEITKRYLNQSIYNNTVIDFTHYINDSFVINHIDTLHLHSFEFKEKDGNKNNYEYLKYIKLNKYVHFDFSSDDIEEL